MTFPGTVRGVVARAEGAPLEIVDIELPPLGPADVRVRVAAAGVCHSDLSMINGTLNPQFPVLLGHEASGTIAEIGDEVEGLAIGDRVVLNWAAACRRCWFCLEGEPWLCAEVEGVVTVPRGRLADGTPLHVCMGVGAFCDQIVVPARSVVPLPSGVPLDVGALLGCAVLTGVGAVTNTARVRPGESVVVVGLGGVGLSAVLGARLSGAGPLIAIDRSSDKEDLARAAGATHFLTSDPKIPRQIRDLTGGRGADHAIECVGTSATIRLAWQMVRRGGTCTIVGVGRKSDEVTFNALELFHFSRTLTTSIYGASDPDRDIPVLAEQVRLGHLDLATLVTHRIGLEGVPEAFDRMTAGQGARSLIEFDH